MHARPLRQCAKCRQGSIYVNGPGAVNHASQYRELCIHAVMNKRIPKSNKLNILCLQCVLFNCRKKQTSQAAELMLKTVSGLNKSLKQMK